MTEKGPKNNKIRALGKGGKSEHGRKIFQRNPPTACCHRHTSKIAANTVFISSVCLVDPETLCKTASKRTRNVSPVRDLGYLRILQCDTLRQSSRGLLMQYCVTLRVWPNSHGYCCSKGRRSHITPLRGHIRYWHLVYCKVVGRREEGQQPANCPPDKKYTQRFLNLKTSCNTP